MKLKYIFAVGVMALLASCDESRFLDIKPQGILNDDLLSSADGVELLVTSAYAGLKGPNRDMHWVPMTNWTYGEVRSDNAYKGGGGVNDGDFCTLLETFKIDATWGNADEKWFQLYCCLQRCNSALRVMNTLDENALPMIKSRKAEMKVIRAHFFFELVRLFKQVPYFDENVENDDYKYIPNNQFTREELLGKIAQEFLDAANDLPDTQSQVGRVTKNIAYAYAAKARLYQAYRQDDNNQVVAIDKQLLAEVVTLCDKVGAQGKAYTLLNDFQKLDQLEYENGVESVFAVQYSMDDETDGAGNINWSNLLNAPKGPYGGDGFFLPSQNLINAYKTDNYGLPLFDTFNADDYGIYEGSELTNIDATVDPRLDFVTGRPGITWKTYTVEPCKANWIRNSGEYGFNCTKRFYISPESEDMFQGWPWGASHLNWQIIRYADVLLWKAEALIEIGEATGLEEARKIINRIRLRAKNSPYVKDFKHSEQDAANYLIGEYPAEGWSQDFARKALRWERRMEFAMEGDRFFDLVRWGIAAETMNSYISVEQNKRVYYRGARFVRGRDEYLPIPNAQYNFSEGNYVQNPGYGKFN